MRLVGRALPHGVLGVSMAPHQPQDRAATSCRFRRVAVSSVSVSLPVGASPSAQSLFCPHSPAQLLTSPLPRPPLQDSFPQGSLPAPGALSPLSRHKRAQQGDMSSALDWSLHTACFLLPQAASHGVRYPIL